MGPGESRLERRVRRDFPEPGSAPEIIRLLADLPRRSGNERLGSERIQAAIVLLANGNVERFRCACELSIVDWRDVLVFAGLDDEDWPDRLNQELGPASTKSGTEPSV